MNTLRYKIYDIIMPLSWAYIAVNYFHKSNSWLYHKINGIDGNGKPTELSEEETKTLKNALLDLSRRIQDVANNL